MSVVASQITSLVIKWKHFPRYWPFVRRIHRSPVNSPHKGQWRGALMFSFICAWINGRVNNREAGDLRRHQAHCDVIVMIAFLVQSGCVGIMSWPRDNFMNQQVIYNDVMTNFNGMYFLKLFAWALRQKQMNIFTGFRKIRNVVPWFWPGCVLTCQTLCKIMRCSIGRQRCNAFIFHREDKSVSCFVATIVSALQWRHNGRDSV